MRAEFLIDARLTFRLRITVTHSFGLNSERANTVGSRTGSFKADSGDERITGTNFSGEQVVEIDRETAFNL
jgi:hypothetical protein